MRRYVILSIIAFIFGFSNVKAAICSNSVMVDYQELAKNITYSYEYNDSNNTFNVIFTNIAEGLDLNNFVTRESYPYSGNEKTLTNLIPGKSYKYFVSTSNSDCLLANFYTIYITLPFYNPYHNDALCNGIENFKYCKKFINKQVTYEEFTYNVNKYLEKTNSRDIGKDEENVKSLFMIAFDFFINYYYIILPIIIVGGIIVIAVYNKKHDLF